jgi:hypothetical protein
MRKQLRVCDRGAVGLDGLVWRKSSRSSDQGDMCVELAVVTGAVAIRDSQDSRCKVILHRESFSRFAYAIKNS